MAGAPVVATGSFLDDALGVLKTVKPSDGAGDPSAAVGGLGVGEVAGGQIEALEPGSGRLDELAFRSLLRIAAKTRPATHKMLIQPEPGV